MTRRTLISALIRTAVVPLSAGLLVGLLVTFNPEIAWRYGILCGPHPVAKVVILIGLFCSLGVALVSLLLAVYYSLTGRKVGWWFASFVLAGVTAFVTIVVDYETCLDDTP